MMKMKRISGKFQEKNAIEWNLAEFLQKHEEVFWLNC